MCIFYKNDLSHVLVQVKETGDAVKIEYGLSIMNNVCMYKKGIEENSKKDTVIILIKW